MRDGKEDALQESARRDAEGETEKMRRLRHVERLDRKPGQGEIDQAGEDEHQARDAPEIAATLTEPLADDAPSAMPTRNEPST